ncbi:MAG TPA: response regulator transcription factor [Actinomycetales bacterium]|nr:response regulator transcription factor [Actinomycetales bacterium]
MTTVVVADDQALVREGLRLILTTAPDLEVVGEASDGDEALAEVRRTRPDVVLMDIRMPGTDGLEATRRLVAGGASTRVLVLTTFDLDEYVYAALKAGASGFLLKSAPHQQLLHAVRTVATGQALLDPTVTARLVERFVARPPVVDGVPEALRQLTPRELDVLREVAAGRSNAEVAAALHLGETTVKGHVAHVLAKLGLRDRVQAVVLAYETGFISPERG